MVLFPSVPTQQIDLYINQNIIVISEKFDVLSVFSDLKVSKEPKNFFETGITVMNVNGFLAREFEEY